MNQNCPVCNKTGLPDYKIQEVTCPQCNSNLRAYMLLTNVTKTSSGGSKIFLPISIFFLAVSLIILFFWNKSEKPVSENLPSIPKTSSVKNDSIFYYKAELAALTDSISILSHKNDIVINYRIKNGDCISKIAYNFFGDWKMYSKIESDNDLVKPYKLNKGQIIKIKLNSK